MENSAGQVDQVFCANCALVWNGTALISNMANEPRRAESEPTIKWFKNHGYEVSNISLYVLICRCVDTTFGKSIGKFCKLRK